MRDSKKDDKGHWWRSRQIKHPDYPAIKRMDEPVFISAADYLPQELRYGIKKLGVLMVQGLENPNPLLEIREVQALEKLVNSTEMIPVYEHLEGFELNWYDWPEVIVGVFAHAAGLEGNDKDDSQQIRDSASWACTEMAQLAHDLLVLFSAEESSVASAYVDELQELIFNSELYLLLAKLRDITTSEKWTEMEYRRLTGEDVNWLEVEKVRNIENPDLFDRKKGGASCFSPPEFPVRTGYFKSRNKTPHVDFLREALCQLDDYSDRTGRSFLIAKEKVISKDAAIWLEPGHWQVITGLLFGIGKSETKEIGGDDGFSKPHIRKLINEHRNSSKYYNN